MENTALITEHEDFFAGLALLHSTDLDSAEKLRRMLDALIARKCGPKKTLGARMGCHDPSTTLMRHTSEFEEDQQEAATFHKCEIDGIATIQAQKFFTQNESITVNQYYQNIPNLIVAVDCKTEIPTISIPDDPGSSSAGDGALCKVCNGGRLGPLILLECQECQDVYHPLCHHPPVLDLDIYDPRLVWHCAKCVELSEAAAIVVVTADADLRDNEYQSKERKKIIDYSYPKPIQQQPDYFRGKVKSSLNFEHTNGTMLMERSKNFGSTSLRIDEPAGLGFSNSSSASSSGHNQLRKRVGSKLTMTRATAK